VGARIAVLERDGTVTHAGAGTKTTGEPADAVDQDTPWGVGSITKTFVAAVVLQLVDEGRIDLDGGITRLVPELAGAERITPRHLLQHTSGLNEYLHHPAVEADAARPWTHSELIAAAESAGRLDEPGGPFHYSNTNYIVLGEIIEQVTGNSVADEVRTRIVEPLGMTDTSFVDGDAAPGYALSGGAFVVPPPRHPSLGASAGAMQSTTSDLLLFAKALADGTLLSPEAQDEMRSFVPGEDLSRFGLMQQYGLGLEAYSNDTVTVVGHMGNGHAYSAFFGYDAELGTAVAVMMNTYNPGAQAFMALETLVALRAR
jgi:D-alanyl-D-alanine carboxypeptidase